MATSRIAPPELVPERYNTWRKEMRFWEMATAVPAKKRAATVFLSLTGKAREVILEMDPDELEKDDGMTKLYDKLDQLFKVDANQAALRAYERFEKYVRPEDSSIADFQIEFDRLVQQLKEHKITLPDPVLAYRALKSASLSEENEKLIMATVSDITLNDMMTQLRKVMGVRQSVARSQFDTAPIKVKQEPNANECLQLVDDSQQQQQQAEGVLYNSQGNRRYNSWNGRSSRGGRRPVNRRGGRSRHSSNSNRGSYRRQNPPGADGNPSTCAICGSILHWARDCQHARENTTRNQSDEDDAVFETNIVLLNINRQENQSKPLLGQTVGATILDSGCSKTVCGKVWYECFLETLPEGVAAKLKNKESDSTFRFGNGSELKSLFHVSLPARLAGKDVVIGTDVIDSDIPLLLSKNSMKKADTVIDFEKDEVWLFGRKQKLCCTDSGHYYVPLAKTLPTNTKDPEILFMRNLESKTKSEKYKIAQKLHKQFSHPSSEKMCSLVRNSGVNDKQMLDILKEVPGNCEICVRYKKNQPRPVVGLPLASRFNEVVAMDIKEIHGHKILHLIDHATRFSVAVKLRNKESSEIVDKVLVSWISIFGSPKQFITDNGREFNNQEFRELAQNFNIVVVTTAAQSPWSNGLNERHNGLLAQMVLKTMEDVNCAIEQALPWATSAKNALDNNSGFSPNQMVFGFNPNTPSALTNQLPALENATSSELVALNLNAMHAARRAFIQSESCEKLQRALRHQIRPSIGATYNNGDRVLYKREQIDRWMGPGSVIGSENKQILVKHGGTYVRVHPCRIMHYNSNPIYMPAESRPEATDQNQTFTLENNKSTEMSSRGQCDYDDMDEICEQNKEGSAETNVHDFENTYVQEQIDSGLPEQADEPVMRRTKQRGRPSTKKAKMPEVLLPKSGKVIFCKLNDEGGGVSDWKQLRVISRAGKNTGKNKNILNVSIEGCDPSWLDFEKSVAEWKSCEEVSIDDNVVESININTDEVLFTDHGGDNFTLAKESELKSWKDNVVYREVPDNGHDAITTRWIYSTREVGGTKVFKARLVAKGFQDKESHLIRSDSPTCGKESLRIMLAILSSKSWSCNSMDIKTAFLQGRSIERQVFVRPPPEANVSEGFIWQLNKCVYGLNDASRTWYLTVKEALLELGATVSKHDQAIFTYYDNGQLQGIVSTHVDDFCWGGTKFFESRVIDQIRNKFAVKCEERHNFRYLGIDLLQDAEEVKLRQDVFVQSLEFIPTRTHYDSETLLSDSEKTLCRSALGRLNWLATQTRPDLCFEVSDLASSLKHSKVGIIAQINKTIRKAKKESSQIHIPKLGRVEKFSIIGYSDASFANVHDVSSHGGYIIYLLGENGRTAPVAWQSRKLKRVVKSTQAAETLALVDLAEASFYFRSLILELLHMSDHSENIPIHCRTDNSGLLESIYSSTQILDKRLRIETALLREMIEKREISSVQWVPSVAQLADALTKKGVPSAKILSSTRGLRSVQEE